MLQKVAMARKTRHNQDKSAGKFCHQLAAWVPDMFWNFYLLKNCKMVNNSATTEALEKISANLELGKF